MSLTIDGKSASSLDVKLKSDYQEPGSPEVRKKEVAVPGRAGVYDFGSEYERRTFQLPLVTLNTSTQSEVQEVVRSLADELTDNNGNPKEVEISFTKEGNKHYKVKLDDSMGITRYPGSLADIQLNLVATEPFALEDNEVITQTISTHGGSVSITNSGTVETPAKISITNDGSETIPKLIVYQEV